MSRIKIELTTSEFISRDELIRVFASYLLGLPFPLLPNERLVAECEFKSKFANKCRRTKNDK